MGIYLGENLVGINNIFSSNNSSGGSGNSNENITTTSLNVTSNGTYTASTNTAYSSVEVNVPTVLKMGVIRPDAELMQTWSYDYMANADLEITIPSYSTSAQTLRASQAMTPTYSITYNNYNWFILERFLTIPTYSISTIGKGRVEYHVGSCAYELAEVPANSYSSFVNPSHKAGAARGFYAAGTFYRSVYYSNTTTLTTYSTSVYTTAQTVTAPGLSSGVVTINTPVWSMRGSTSYFVNTYFNAITDIRFQFVAELYRVPKNNLNIDGWQITSQLKHIVDCINTTNHKLT